MTNSSRLAWEPGEARLFLSATISINKNTGEEGNEVCVNKTQNCAGLEQSIAWPGCVHYRPLEAIPYQIARGPSARGKTKQLNKG